MLSPTNAAEVAAYEVNLKQKQRNLLLSQVRNYTTNSTTVNVVAVLLDQVVVRQSFIHKLCPQYNVDLLYPCKRETYIQLGCLPCASVRAWGVRMPAVANQPTPRKKRGTHGVGFEFGTNAASLFDRILCLPNERRARTVYVVHRSR